MPLSAVCTRTLLKVIEEKVNDPLLEGTERERLMTCQKWLYQDVLLDAHPQQTKHVNEGYQRRLKQQGLG